MDPVNNPSHNNQGSIEAIAAIREALGAEGFIAYCRGNALKYLWRCEYKSNRTEDLRKADWYIKQAAITSAHQESE